MCIYDIPYLIGLTQVEVLVRYRGVLWASEGTRNATQH